MASLLFLFLLIAQFIAYFNFTRTWPRWLAVKLGDVLEDLDIGAVWLLIGFIIVTMVVDLIIPAAIAKWAILAPIFIPLFIRLDVAPQTVLAAYRVGDSPPNVVTPLMAYFPLIVVFVKRYHKDAGIGTVVSLMLPYVVILVGRCGPRSSSAWYLLGHPARPGLAGRHLRRRRAEQVQPEPLGEQPRGALALDAVARGVQARGEAAHAALAGRDGHDAAADAALGRAGRRRRASRRRSRRARR